MGTGLCWNVMIMCNVLLFLKIKYRLTSCTRTLLFRKWIPPIIRTEWSVDDAVAWLHTNTFGQIDYYQPMRIYQLVDGKATR